MCSSDLHAVGARTRRAVAEIGYRTDAEHADQQRRDHRTDATGGRQDGETGRTAGTEDQTGLQGCEDGTGGTRREWRSRNAIRAARHPRRSPVRTAPAGDDDGIDLPVSR